jgi:Ca-activated chloride channel family protein
LGRARLFTVGIGSAPNGLFMRKAAQFGRGSFTYIADVAEVEEKISTLFNKLASPAISNVSIQWPKHLSVEQWPRRLPDVYDGEPLLVLVKLTDMNAAQKIAGDVQLSGDIVNLDGTQQRWSKNVPLPVTNNRGGNNNKGIASLWGRKKIDDLLDEKIRGGDEAAIAKQVLEVALRQQLLSPYTSFIAVEETASRPEHQPLRTHRLANAKPQGQSIKYPKTATSASFNLLLGGGLLLLFLFCQCLLRRDEKQCRSEQQYDKAVAYV